MKVKKRAFDTALDKLLKAKPLPLADIPMRDGQKRGPAEPPPPTKKKATR